MGHALAGLLFSQLWYWSGRQPDDRDGWFYMTQAQIFEETAITRREQETCRRKLRHLGILEEALRGHPAQLWYRINVTAVVDLLVLAHMREQAVCGYAGEPDRGELRRESHSPEVAAHTLCFGCFNKTQPNRKVEGQNHAEAYCLAMQQPGTEPGLRFERMPEGMAEI